MNVTIDNDIVITTRAVYRYIFSIRYVSTIFLFSTLYLLSLLFVYINFYQLGNPRTYISIVGLGDTGKSSLTVPVALLYAIISGSK